MTLNKKLLEKELDIAMANRLFEIQLFWQRSNYFLGLMVAMGVATYSVKSTNFIPLVLLAGSLASYFWFKTNIGSKYWQESWEKEVYELSKEFGIRSFEKSGEEIKSQVKESLETNSNRSDLRIHIDKMILKKPSVTYNMILLSLISTATWIMLLIGWIVDWLIEFRLAKCIMFGIGFLNLA